MSASTDPTGGVRVALLAAGVALVGACGSGGPGDDPRGLALGQPDDVLERAHERALQQRATDPTAGGGFSYEQVSLGACLRTRATPGAPSGEAGLRGTVSTEAVVCPDGVLPLAEEVPVDATSTRLDRLRTPVPADIGRPCLSGTRDCSGG